MTATKDTAYEKHKGLLHQFARKYFVQAQSLGLGITYEDIYGEMCLSYAKAVKSFDPNRNNGFGAYLGRACAMNIFRVLDKLVRERWGDYNSDGTIRETMVGRKQRLELEALALAQGLPPPPKKVPKNPSYGLRMVSDDEIPTDIVDDHFTPLEDRIATFERWNQIMADDTVDEVTKAALRMMIDRDFEPSEDIKNRIASPEGQKRYGADIKRLLKQFREQDAELES